MEAGLCGRAGKQALPGGLPGTGLPEHGALCADILDTIVLSKRWFCRCAFKGVDQRIAAGRYGSRRAGFRIYFRQGVPGQQGGVDFCRYDDLQPVIRTDLCAERSKRIGHRHIRVLCGLLFLWTAGKLLAAGAGTSRPTVCGHGHRHHEHGGICVRCHRRAADRTPDRRYREQSGDLPGCGADCLAQCHHDSGSDSAAHAGKRCACKCLMALMAWPQR